MSTATEAKHTSGPWIVSQQQGLRLFIVGKDEAIAETLHMAWDDEQFANARLIAAAPAMLEALEALASGDWVIKDQLIINAQAAIALAKGETE